MAGIKLIERFRGSLLGLAIGDALGAPIEFEKRDTYTPVSAYRAGGPFNLKEGQWTDDTSLALCLGFSLVEKRDFVPADIMKRFHSWWREGYMSCTGHCFDIGNTTKAALTRFEEKAELFSGDPTDPATNGSIMRLAPVPLFYFKESIEKVVFFSGESSRLTHAPLSCIDACKALGLMIDRALKGKTKDQILHYEKGMLGELSPEIEAVLLGSYKTKTREDISAAGLAHTCLEAALWAFYQTDHFNDGVLLAVNLGEDSDTTGAVYGQLAGAYYGVRGIKSEFSDGLWDKKLIETLGQKLYEHANGFYYEGENPTVDLFILNPENEVLLIRRSKTAVACADMMAFPGGFIDSEAGVGELWKSGLETPEAAAIRELAEETNLQLKHVKLELVGTYSGNNRDPRDNDLSWSKTYAFYYRIDKETYQAQKEFIRGMDDADEARWVPLSEARKMKLAFDHNRILEEAIKKYSPEFPA